MLRPSDKSQSSSSRTSKRAADLAELTGKLVAVLAAGLVVIDQDVDALDVARHGTRQRWQTVRCAGRPSS